MYVKFIMIWASVTFIKFHIWPISRVNMAIFALLLVQMWHICPTHATSKGLLLEMSAKKSPSDPGVNMLVKLLNRAF